MTGTAMSPEADLSMHRSAAAPARRWNRGVWIRFALAISPTVVFAIMGIILTHTS